MNRGWPREDKPKLTIYGSFFDDGVDVLAQRHIGLIMISDLALQRYQQTCMSNAAAQNEGADVIERYV